MKITVAPVSIPMGRFSMKIRDPGVVRMVAFELKEKLISMGLKKDVEERPVVFIEAAIDGTIRERSFVAFAQGDTFEPDDGETATYRGSGISGHTGLVVHVFEIKNTDA